MKNRLTQLACGFAVLLCLLSPQAMVAAEPNPVPPLGGIWKWTFTMPDGSEVTPRLELKQDAGQLTGSTRVRAGTETPITNATVNGSEVSFQVVRGDIVTRYSGLWSNNVIKGKMISNWAGQEQSYDWEARRASGVAGVWKWSTGFGGARVESRLTLKQEGERLTGKVTVPRTQDTDIKHGRLKGVDVSFQIERERDGETSTNRYYGKLSGDKITGKTEGNVFGQNRTNNWEATRVE